MKELLIGLTLAAVSALVWLAYNKPKQYDKLWGILAWLCFAVFLGLGGVRLGLALAGEKLNGNKAAIDAIKAINGFDNEVVIASIVVGVLYLFLLFLSTFPLWLHDD